MDAEMDENVAVPEPAAPVEDSVTAQQLVEFLARARFHTTIGRRGYHQGEVDAFLKRLAEDVQAEEPLADVVRRTKFTHVRLEDGYDPTQVDDFLAAVVDLDPHSVVKPEPELARSGLIAKLFG